MIKKSGSQVYKSPCETLEEAQTIYAAGVLSQEEFSKRVAARAAQC
jgi:hypothetical protein